MNVFREFSEDAWPPCLAPLKGRKLRRKKDGGLYIIRRPTGQSIGGKPAAYLEPAGCDWEARSHWKTHSKICSDFTVVDLE